MCDPRHDHRRTLRTALVAEGFRSIKNISELAVMPDIVEKTVPGLIVIDLDLPDGSSRAFINDVRNGNLGMNLFIPIIVLLGMRIWRASSQRSTQVSTTY
ncbi:MAG: hypothetical protein ACPGQV_16335 [Alphaproteobacteria bacterium]